MPPDCFSTPVMFGAVMAHQKPSYRRLNKPGICIEQGLIAVRVFFFFPFFFGPLSPTASRPRICFSPDSMTENALNHPYPISNVKISDLISFPLVFTQLLVCRVSDFDHVAFKHDPFSYNGQWP